MSAMRQYLADAPPVTIDANGELHSVFPFTVCVGACNRCHGPLVTVCGLRQCPACPVINDWLAASRQALSIARARAGRRITLEVI
jgi:hypothetical protein